MIESNPCGLRGLAFVEIAGPDPNALRLLLLAFGFSRTLQHTTRTIDVYEQRDIYILLNRSVTGHAARFAATHGPCICALGWRTADARLAVRAATSRGATLAVGDLHHGDERAVPAISGIGESLIYLVDSDDSWLSLGFVPLDDRDRVPTKGFIAIDHLTNNVARGELERWAAFYREIFGFTDVRYFDIRGEKTGLHSFALRSPCGTFCIPINEGSDIGSGKRSQIDEYLDEYKGPGIQHLAFLTADLLGSLRALEHTSIAFLDIEADYYLDVFDRVPGIREDHAELARRQVLVDGDEHGYLLQIFTKNLLGPIFIELIQRHNHLSFGEGNFGALFRSIERDQQRRGYFT